MADFVLPNGTLSVFPVQFFGRNDATRVPVARPPHASEAIRFGNSFGGGRTHAGHTTGHGAIDILAARGTPVFAAMDGVVPATWAAQPESGVGVVRLAGVGTPAMYPAGDGGNFVMIVDSSGRHHYYAHMNAAPLVRVGDRVCAGQQLGVVGNTGAPTSPPHLHYQITTRARGGLGGMQHRWNQHTELVDLAQGIGGARHGARIEIHYDAFADAVLRGGSGVADPWTGRTTPEVVDPWNRGFARR